MWKADGDMMRWSNKVGHIHPRFPRFPPAFPNHTAGGLRKNFVNNPQMDNPQEFSTGMIYYRATSNLFVACGERF